jgi:hypothetical protein
MYAFAQRTDTRVVDEPLYGHYLRVSGAEHPGRDEVMAAMDTDGNRVVRDVLLGPCDHPVLFIKNMAHHFTELDRGFLDALTHVLLIRDPKEMLPSLVNQIPAPSLADTALKHQVDLVDHLQRLGRTPPVLDARHLLLNPKAVLAQLCHRLGLPFDDAMLHWDAGARPEDGVWAPYWYHNVHRSTGFSPYRPKTAPFPALLKPLLQTCQPYYERLYDLAIKAED